jgi:S1 RNA binding domain protein
MEFMSLEVGSIVEGIVTGITDFGAFVEVEKGKTGLVHISEVAEDYVKDIKNYLKRGQKIKVKVLNIDKDGKISLSIKQAGLPKKKTVKPREVNWEKEFESPSPINFEDKMSKFLKDSEEKMQSINTKKSSGRKNANNRGN